MSFDDINKSNFLRFFLIFLGIGILLFLLIDIFNNISSLNFLDFEFFMNFVNKILIIFVIGIFILYIGIFWDRVFLKFTKIIVSIGVFFLTLAIFLFVINFNSSQISDSIQPSVDYLVAYSMDDLLDSNFKVNPNDTVKLSFPKDSKTTTIYVKNLTLKQTELFLDIVDLNKYSSEERLKIVKFLVSLIYDEILKNSPNSLNSSIPLSFVKDSIAQTGVDINQIFSFDVLDFGSSFIINDDAYLNILISSGEVIEDINIGEIDETQVNLIWDNLGFNKNVSYNTKYKVSIIILSILNEQDQMFNGNPIPSSLISGYIPADFKKILSLDIFSENISLRVNNIGKIRNLCEDDNVSIDEVCGAIMITKYENLVQNLDNISNNQSLPVNISLILNNYGSVDKINKSIEDKTINWLMFFFLFLFLIILAHIIYYLHFKLFKREFLDIYIPYFIAKQNLINFVFSFIFFGTIYFLIKSSKLIDYILTIMGNESFLFIKDFPLIESLIIIFDNIFYIFLLYFIFSLILYLIFYFLLKKEVSRLSLK